MPQDDQYNIKMLLCEVGKGNEHAFKSVFDFYKERFYAASLKMTHDGDIAEEIVQEVFVALWVKRAQVATATNPEGYLFTMLHNSIYAHFRKLAAEKSLKKKIEDKAEYVNINPVEDRLLGRENDKMLEALISQLPQQQKLVYKLSKQEGLSRLEIAAQLHISPHTVKNHLQEAIRFIRSYYKAGASALVWIAILQSL